MAMAQSAVDSITAKAVKAITTPPSRAVPSPAPRSRTVRSTRQSPPCSVKLPDLVPGDNDDFTRMDIHCGNPMRSGLKVCQWNCVILQETCRRDGIDVFLLQETLLQESAAFFPGFRAFLLTHIIGISRGCAILIRNSLNCTPLVYPIDCGDWV